MSEPTNRFLSLSVRGAVAGLLLVSMFVLVGCGTRVPNVKGMTLEQARVTLSSAGFKLAEAEYDPLSRGAVGAVVGQTPSAEARASEGSVVTLMVAGSPPVPVPTITGLELATAEAALKALGLTAGQVTRSHDESLPVGTVINAVPEPGALVQRGSAVNMIVSKGRTPIDVPSVKGMTEKSAVKLLKDAGFRVTTTKDESEAKSGTVIAQKPSAGMALSPGQTITVTVSAGVSLVTVPNAERYDRGSMDSSQDIPGLRAAFSKLGLKLQIRSHSFPWAFEQGGSDEEGSFFGQSPAPGTKARRGTMITVHQLTYPPVN